MRLSATCLPIREDRTVVALHESIKEWLDEFEVSGFLTIVRANHRLIGTK